MNPGCSILPAAIVPPNLGVVMKISKIMYGAMFIFIIALIFSACPNGTTDNDETQKEEEEERELETEGKTITLKNIKVTGDPLFFSLSTGKQVTDPKSKDWDVAFPGYRQIWTNSGDSAAKYQSGGQGGVWYTDKKDFAAVTGKDDAIMNDDDPAFQILKSFNTDKARWAIGMDTNANFVTLHKQINVMSFVGHGNENEPEAGMSQDTAYDETYLYDKKQFYYNAAGMPPIFQPTKQVYVIRHGDGVHYSKFQVTAYDRNPDKFTVKFENLPEG
jgi:hypothetical protein